MPSDHRPSGALTKFVFLGLKAGNLIAITVYSFALIFVLVRVVPAGAYPWIVLVSSIGNYVLATDLGYAGFVYASVRKSFIDGDLAPRASFISEAVNIYAWISVAAAIVAAVVIGLAPPMGGGSLNLGLGIFFFSIVLSLPWALLRRSAAAIDLFLEFEVIEFLRRVTFLGLAGAMLAGLSFVAFGLLCLAAWALAFFAAVTLLKRRDVHLRLHTPRALKTHLKENLPNISKSGSFTILEFVLYNAPYLLVPALFGSPAFVVVFDVFYKVVRFGGVSYSVATETYLPYQTRAFYEGDQARVHGYTLRIIGLSLIPFSIASAFILIFGDAFFGRLLDYQHTVSAPVRYAMVAMLMGTLFQSAAGTFLVGVNQYALLSRLAAVVVAIMALVCGIVFWLHLPFEAFMGLYVAVYALYAAAFQIAFRHFVAASGK